MMKLISQDGIRAIAFLAGAIGLHVDAELVVEAGMGLVALVHLFRVIQDR